MTKWNRIAMLCLAMVQTITGCTNQANSVPQQNQNIVMTPTFAPVPTTTFSIRSDEFIKNNPTLVQSVIQVYDSKYQGTRTVSMADSVFGKKTFFSYALINYSKVDTIYVAVSLPADFRVGQYKITQLLDPSYGSDDPAMAGAVYRDLPEELSAFGEPETAGDSCNQSVTGQITIARMQPLQGNFQFNCQFEDGRAASLAGTFSQ